MLPSQGLALLERLNNTSATVGVIGLGYVGLPLAVTAASRGLPVIGFEVDPAKLDLLDQGTTYIDAVSQEALDGVVGKTFTWTGDSRVWAAAM